jgi:Short C-terminal domain
MVVIFGFGAGRPDDLGEVVPTVCPNCHNQVFLHHVRSKKSVRLYFVPVVPYGTDDYLVCPVCSQGLQLSAAQLPHLRSMSAAVTAYRTGRIPEAQLMRQADLFWRQLGVSPAGVGQRPPAPPGRGAYPPAQQGIPPQPTVPPQSARAQPAAPAQPAAAAQPPPAAADDEKSWIAQLRKLSELHDQGVLSDAAYAAAKQRIIKQE